MDLADIEKYSNALVEELKTTALIAPLVQVMNANRRPPNVIEDGYERLGVHKRSGVRGYNSYESDAQPQTVKQQLISRNPGLYYGWQDEARMNVDPKQPSLDDLSIGAKKYWKSKKVPQL